MTYSKTRGLALSAIFAALISVVAPIRIPLTPQVPLTLQVFIVYLAMMVAGPVYGAFALVIYLLLGAAGLPVYAGGSGGVTVLAGPTAGYLFAFPVAAFLGGLLCSRRGSTARRDTAKLAASAALAILVIYGLGVAWLGYSLHFGVMTSLAVGAVPFVPFDIVKAVVAIPIALRLRRSPLQLPIRPEESKSSSSIPQGRVGT